jgi:hypothetical protein
MRMRVGTSLKAFAIELVRKKTKTEQKGSDPWLKVYRVQLAVLDH